MRREILAIVTATSLVAGAAGAQTPLILKAPPNFKKAVAGDEADVERPNALGNALVDLVYTPLPVPCRVLDTRGGTGVVEQFAGPLASGALHAFKVANNFDSCGIPGGTNGAAAVMINMIAVQPSAAGFMRMWPWDSSMPGPPNASVLNYAAVTGLNITNGVVVPICNTASATGGLCSDDLFVRVDGGSTHLVVDTLGYFAPPAVTSLSCVTIQEEATLPAGAYSSVTSPSCTVPGQIMISGGCANSAQGQVLLTDSHITTTNGGSWICFYKNTDTANEYSIDAYAQCCGVPGKFN